jgi:muconolactone delta-isomerase
MRADRVQLADNGRLRALGRVQGRHQARATTTDDDHIKLVDLCHAFPPNSRGID